MLRSIKEKRADLSDAALTRTRDLMCHAVPDRLVTGHEHLVAGLDLPDADDRHVLAAAIRANAQARVTFNLKDFPDHVLARYDMEAKHPDDFVLDSIDIAPGAVVKCIIDQSTTLRSPAVLVPELLDTLRRTGLVRSVARLRDLLGPAATGDLRP